MISFQRRIDIIRYAWIDSKKANSLTLKKKGRMLLFFDIVHFSFKYEKDTRDYLKLEYYNKNKEERKRLSIALEEQLRFKHFRDAQLVFHTKWTLPKWEHPKKFNKRTIAYRKNFNIGEGLSVRYNVWIMSAHNCIGELKIGKHCYLGRNSEIDYTGGLIIGNNVDMSEGCMILTHSHTIQRVARSGDKHKCVETPLTIEDNVWIGANAMILPGVNKIGRGAVVGAGAVVRHEVPPYAILAGNPAKITGFAYTPEEISEIEQQLYPIEERIPKELLEKNYCKYFLKNIKEIKTYTKLGL